MDKHKWLHIVGGVVALVLICVLLVGLINGVWPWSGKGFFGNYKGNAPSQETQQTTQSTQKDDDSQATGESGSINPEADIKIPLDTKEDSAGPGDAVESTGAGAESTETESTQETTKAPGNEQEISFEDLPKKAEN